MDMFMRPANGWLGGLALIMAASNLVRP